MHNNSFNKERKQVYVNHDIKAPNLVIVDENRNIIWKYPRRIAFEKAEQDWLDLVQVSYDPKEMVSTVIMTDYGKYMYQKTKWEKEKRKKQKQQVLKEIKLSYAIWDNDLQLKINKARELLEAWSNVKLSIRLKWRENIYKDKWKEKIMHVVQELSDVAKTQFNTPKEEWKWFSILLFSK